MAHHFWVKTARGVAGPFSSQQIRQAAAKGTLKPEDQVSNDRDNWVTAAGVKGLRFCRENDSGSRADGLEAQAAEWLDQSAAQASHGTSVDAEIQNAQWFWRVMGTDSGPVSFQELHDMALGGVLAPDALVRMGPAGEWVSADRIQGLFEPARSGEHIRQDNEHPTQQSVPSHEPASESTEHRAGARRLRYYVVPLDSEKEDQTWQVEWDDLQFTIKDAEGRDVVSCRVDEFYRHVDLGSLAENVLVFKMSGSESYSFVRNPEACRDLWDLVAVGLKKDPDYGRKAMKRGLIAIPVGLLVAAPFIGAIVAFVRSLPANFFDEGGTNNMPFFYLVMSVLVTPAFFGIGWSVVGLLQYRKISQLLKSLGLTPVRS